MSNDSAPKTLPQSTTGNSTSLSQLSNITEAFIGEDFTKITSEDFKKNPLAGRMMTMLYAENAKKLVEANEKILELTKLVSYYQSFPITNVGYAVMNIVGTVIVGIGVSLSDNNKWLIILGGILVLAGNILPIIFRKKNC